MDRFCREVQTVFVEYMDFVNKSQGLYGIYMPIVIASKSQDLRGKTSEAQFFSNSQRCHYKTKFRHCERMNEVNSLAMTGLWIAFRCG